MSANTLIRKHLLAQDDILKCRITRNGEVHVYTNAQRGDGGLDQGQGIAPLG